MYACETLIQRYETEQDGFIQLIITGVKRLRKSLRSDNILPYQNKRNSIKGWLGN